MLTIQYDAGSGLTVRGLRPEEAMSVQTVDNTLTAGGSVSSSTTQDREVTTTTSAASTTNFDIVAGSLDPRGAVLGYTNQTPSFCTVDSDGSVTLADLAVGSYECVIDVLSGVGNSRVRRLITKGGSATVVANTTDTAQNSLQHYLLKQQQLLAAAFNPSTALSKYATGFMLNANRSGGGYPTVTGYDWFPDYAAWANGSGYQWLAPKFVVLTAHMGTPPAHSGSPTHRLILNANGTSSDITIAYTGTSSYVNSTAPANYTCSVLPATWRTYLPSLQDGLLPLPAFCPVEDSTNRVRMLDITRLVAWPGPYPLDHGATSYAATTGVRAPFSPFVSGNTWFASGSGTPMFIGIGGVTVLLGKAYLGTGIFPWLSDYITEIETAMDQLANVFEPDGGGGTTMSLANRRLTKIDLATVAHTNPVTGLSSNGFVSY